MALVQDERERYLGAVVDDLPTPSLVVDIPRLEANIARWQRGVSSRGPHFRPHVKTHKSPEIGRMQLEAGARGITVAKVAEAEVFAAAGFDDIVVAYPVFGAEKWERLARVATDARITVNVDNAQAVRGLSAAAERSGVSINVQIDLDSGLHRGGIPAESTDALYALAQLVVELPGVEFDGITTFRGPYFDGGDGMSIEEAGRAEGRLIVGVAESLRARGLEVREVSAGSTITGFGVADVPGVTEVRAGTYVFNDLMQLGFGSATLEDCALTVHTTVVSAGRPGEVTVDGGSKTFSGDRGVSAENPEIARGVGKDVVLVRMTEEHGMARVGAGEFAVGDRIAFIPPHVCTVVNLSDELFGARDGVVETVWPVRARGKRT
jgi:D-serine deaminase-like pyridoxal phosphate-dependent protein